MDLRVEPVCANPLRRSAARSEIKEPRLISRYTREQTGAVWRDANKYAKWLEVELAATETLAEAGDVPKETAAKIRANAKIDGARVQELESRVKQGVLPSPMAGGKSIGDPAAARWFHYG